LGLNNSFKLALFWTYFIVFSCVRTVLKARSAFLIT